MESNQTADRRQSDYLLIISDVKFLSFSGIFHLVILICDFSSTFIGPLLCSHFNLKYPLSCSKLVFILPYFTNGCG